MVTLTIKPRVSAIGFTFRVSLVDEDGAKLDLTGLNPTMIFRRPDETTFTRTASISSPATDGVVYYITTADDLTQAGTWRLQVDLENNSDTIDFRSDILKFKVEDNL